MTYRDPAEALHARVAELERDNARLLDRGPVRQRYDAMSAWERAAFPIIVLGWPIAAVALPLAAEHGGVPGFAAAVIVGSAWWAWAMHRASGRR